MIRRFVAANDRAGSTGDWGPMARLLRRRTRIYTWNNGPKYEFVARGRDEIRDFVFGTEMAGLEKWIYPYVRTLIDDQKGEVIGIWRQIAPVEKADGKPYEIAGTGGSWFRYAGNCQWAGSATSSTTATRRRLPGDGEGEAQREDAGAHEAGSKMPGWVKRSEFDWYATLTKGD